MKSESEVVRPRGLRLAWTVAAVGLLVVSLLVGIAAGPGRPRDRRDPPLARRAAPRPGRYLADTGRGHGAQGLRVPRVVLGALVGGMLALAGAAYQGVFRNPLADPYLGSAPAAGAGPSATPG